MLLAFLGPVTTAGAGPALSPTPVGNRGPLEVVLSPDGSRAYVSEHREGTVAVVDARSGAVLTRWAVGERPAGVALTPDGSLLVSDDFAGAIYRISYQAAQ